MKTIDDFYAALAHDEYRFIYRKKNGEIRCAIGTTCVDKIPSEHQPTGQAIKMNEDNKRYFDTDSNGWRSFNKSNIIWTPFTGFTNNIKEEEKSICLGFLKEFNYI